MNLHFQHKIQFMLFRIEGVESVVAFMHDKAFKLLGGYKHNCIAQSIEKYIYNLRSLTINETKPISFNKTRKITKAYWQFERFLSDS